MNNFRCDVCFDVPYVETFDVKFSTYGTSKILCMSLSVIEAYDQKNGCVKMALPLPFGHLKQLLRCPGK